MSILHFIVLHMVYTYSSNKIIFIVVITNVITSNTDVYSYFFDGYVGDSIVICLRFGLNWIRLQV